MSLTTRGKHANQFKEYSFTCVHVSGGGAEAGERESLKQTPSTRHLLVPVPVGSEAGDHRSSIYFRS